MAIFCQFNSASLSAFEPTKPISIETRDPNNNHPMTSRIPVTCRGSPSTTSYLFGFSPKIHERRSQSTTRLSCSSLKKVVPRKPCLKVSMATRLSRERVIPNRRVTFADARGLDLTDVKYLFESSNDPPQSFIDGDSLFEAMKYLGLQKRESTRNLVVREEKRKVRKRHKFNLEFAQPFQDFQGLSKKVSTHKVALESCNIENSGVLSGQVKVKNLAFDKKVTVRMTTDGWASFVDRECRHDPAKSNPDQDTFSFCVNDLARELPPNCTSAHFCIKYECQGQNYWDNNDERNYTINIQQFASDEVDQGLEPAYERLQNAPVTYGELPSPQDSVWANQDPNCPFW